MFVVYFFFQLFFCTHVQIVGRVHTINSAEPQPRLPLVVRAMCRIICTHINCVCVCACYFIVSTPLKICIEQGRQTVIGNTVRRVLFIIFFSFFVLPYRTVHSHTHAHTQDERVADVVLKLLHGYNAHMSFSLSPSFVTL